MKHTKEPWAITKASWQTSLIVAPHNGWTVAELSIEDNEDTAEAEGAIRDANAARIVACVNACAGINPEAVPEMVAALEAIALLYENPEPPSMHELGQRAYDMRCIARAAFTKAREVQP